jgi:hypothetical protein
MTCARARRGVTYTRRTSGHGSQAIR